MKKIIFLGGLFPKELRNEIEQNSKGIIQYAADALQWSIIKGLKQLPIDLRVVNLPFVGSFPLRFNKFRMITSQFAIGDKKEHINLGFINLPVYKLFSRYYQAKVSLRSLLKQEEYTILIYSMHTPFLKAAADLKKEFPLMKICLIVPDLPQFMNDSSFLETFYRMGEKRVLDKTLQSVDSFVILSKFMHSPLKIQTRPWVVMEGIYNSGDTPVLSRKENNKTILYTGTLARRYGIINLLEAFSMIGDNSYQLWICGEGDSRKDVLALAEKDKRVTYFGQIPREKVLELQLRATVLVNPRTSEGEYTKYSFPSKIMEYLASGTPCIMHKLEGIPDEYFDYCYIADKETATGLYTTILNVCSKDPAELITFGKRARTFIIQNKSPEVQTKKIVNMLIQEHN